MPRRLSGRDQPLEVRERLGDGETPLRRGMSARKERERQLVARVRLGRERCERVRKALVMVLDDLACAPCGVVDRLPVGGQGEPRGELDRPPKGA